MKVWKETSLNYERIKCFVSRILIYCMEKECVVFLEDKIIILIFSRGGRRDTFRFKVSSNRNLVEK